MRFTCVLVHHTQGWLDDVKSKSYNVSLACPVGCVDLTKDAVVITASESPRVDLYAQILATEVAKRSCVTLPVHSTEAFHAKYPEEASRPVAIVLLIDPKLEELGTEGYRIEASATQILITGPSERSILFGVGRFLREAHLDFHQSYAVKLTCLCAVSESLTIASRPEYRMRQHQVAYRPKTNSCERTTRLCAARTVSPRGTHRVRLAFARRDRAPWWPSARR